MNEFPIPEQTGAEGLPGLADRIARLADCDINVMQRLADWLIEVRSAAEESSRVTNVESEIGSGTNTLLHSQPGNPGLFRLAEEFTALRQDVKLQAKSARGLHDQAGLLLSGLREAMDQFQSVTPREQQAAKDAVKPLLESLTDLDAALDRGRLAAESARARWLDEKSFYWHELVDAELRVLPRWKRWLLSSFFEKLKRTMSTRFIESWTASQNAQVEGYRLVQNRLRRLLHQNDVERIEVVGHLVDPNRMTVVDVTDHDEFPSGTVLEELRPGYFWRGQLLRYAEVRVARLRTENFASSNERNPANG